MANYVVGNTIQLTWTFKDATGALVDPSTEVYLCVLTPAAVQTNYAYGEQLVERVGVGTFRKTLFCNQTGTYSAVAVALNTACSAVLTWTMTALGSLTLPTS